MEKVMELLPVLDELARQRFRQQALAEEATSYALEKWAAEGWKKVHAHRGDGAFRAYFERVSRNLLNDFARKRFGRPRPPENIKALGALAIKLYELLCLEGYSSDEAAAIVKYEVPGGRQPELLNHYIRTILDSVYDCGVHYREQSLEDGDTIDYAVTSVEARPETRLFAIEESTTLEALRQCCQFAHSGHNEVDKETLCRVRHAMHEALVLADEERLLLQFVYQDAMSVSEAGRLLGLGAAQTHGRLRRLLQRIRTALDKALPC